MGKRASRKLSWKYLSIAALVGVGVVVIGKTALQGANSRSYHAGEYTVTAQKAGSAGSGLQQCNFSAQYQGETIPLGTYPQKGDCSMSQTPRLSNGDLAVITQAYVFLYDPKTKQVITLNPLSIPEFGSFAKEKGIDLYSDFPQKRFIFAGSTLQILYTRKSDDTRSPQLLSFISSDNGKTFTFDKNTE